MEDSWPLSTPMSLNANTPTFETKETKTQRELFKVIDEINERRQLQQNQSTGNLLGGNSR